MSGTKFSNTTPPAPIGQQLVTFQTDGQGNISAAIPAGGGGGGVSSVAMTGDGVIFNATVPGSPITTSGTLIPTLLTQAANKVLAGPTTGGAATPTFRLLVAADVPNLPASIITTGQLALARGGTNADLSATGGASKVLQQVSVGAAITVAQLAASDLSNGVTGSGAVVLATSPTLVTPILGVASATSLNIATGITIAGAATTGNVLRGNGTNFVSAALAFSDLSGTASTGQIPSLDASKITTGLLALARGGTNADLSATGGASQVLQQVSAGAAITVGQLAASDLSNGVTGSGAVVLATAPTITSLAMSGKITTYNNIVIVGNGVPSEVASVALTLQSAAKVTTTLYAVPASGAGQYRISWNAKVTRAATTSSTLGALTISYTDPDGVVITTTMPGVGVNPGSGIGETVGLNTTGAVLFGFPLTLNCKASTNITYAFAYVSSGATTMQYNLNILLEAH